MGTSALRLAEEMERRAALESQAVASPLGSPAEAAVAQGEAPAEPEAAATEDTCPRLMRRWLRNQRRRQLRMQKLLLCRKSR